MIQLQKRQSLRKTLYGLFLFVSLTAICLCFPGRMNAQAPTGNLPPHQATVSWTNGVDPAGDTLTGSNVYRCPGTCTLTSGTFANLTSTPLSASTLSYVDKAVTESSTYSYCVTNLVTLSTGPFETPCSSVVSATIPKAPAAPSGVSAVVQ